MASVFNALDDNLSHNSEFWYKLDPKSPEDPLTSVVYTGNLMLKLKSKLKVTKCVLTKTHLYCVSNHNLPKYKAFINWKLLTCFVEETETTKMFGFRLGDEIFQDFYVNDENDLNCWVDRLAQVTILSSFEQDLVVIKPISDGKGSEVFLCKYWETGQEFVLKMFRKVEIEAKPSVFKQVLNEINALRIFDNDKIVKLHRIYETEAHVYLMLDYFPHGDLCQWYSKQKTMDENLVVKIIREVLKALNYVHSVGIAHRDIKLENVAIVENDLEVGVKLIDFGLSCEYANGLFQKCGSLGCIAPEVFKSSGYNSKVDIFSTGVLFYKLLTGKSLFPGETAQEIFDLNKKCELNLSCKSLKKVSKQTIDLLRSLLSVDPFQRCTAAEALAYPFTSQSKSQKIIIKLAEATPESIDDECKSHRFA